MLILSGPISSSAFFCLTEKLFRVAYDAVGGRRTGHLAGLSQKANNYNKVLIIVGNNDPNSLAVEAILDNLRSFLNSLRSDIKKRICAFLPRRDNHILYDRRTQMWCNPVTEINKRLQREFGYAIASARFFKLDDFGTRNKKGKLRDLAHLNERGYLHMSIFTASECRKFLSNNEPS